MRNVIIVSAVFFLTFFASLSYTPAFALERILVVYSPSANGTTDNHHFRLYDGSTIGPEQSSPGNQVYEARRIIARASYTEEKYLIGHLQGDTTPELYLFENASGTYTALNGGSYIGGTNIPDFEGGFDIAYERSSGDALIVYIEGTALRYRTYSSAGVLSAEGTISGTLAESDTYNYRTWITLRSKPNSNEIALLYATSSDSGYLNPYELCACIWDGTAWSTTLDIELTNDIETVYARCFDACYEEGGDNDLLVVYGEDTAGIRRRYLRSGSWAAATSVDPGLADSAWNVAMACKPGSDIISVVWIEEAAADLGAARWNGGDLLENATDLDTACIDPDTEYYQMSVATGWFKDGGDWNPIITYCDSTGPSDLNWYKSADGGQTWVQQTPWAGQGESALQGNGNVQFLYMTKTGDLLLAWQDSDAGPDISLMRYDGTSWSNVMGSGNLLEDSADDDAGWCVCVAVLPPLADVTFMNCYDSSAKGTQYTNGSYQTDNSIYFEFGNDYECTGFYYYWGGSAVGAPDTSASYYASITGGNAAITDFSGGSGVYYFRVMAENVNGNGSIYTFIYNYDVAAPSAPNPCYCEDRVDPAGLTDYTPGFKATYNDTFGIGVDYEIEVGDDNNWGDGAEMWDTGWVSMSDVNVGENCAEITYGGAGLSPGMTYYWRICFRDKVGNGGAWSGTQQFNMLGNPQNFRCAGCSSTTLTWAWDDVTGEIAYDIFDNDTGTVVISDIAADSSSTEEINLSINTTYRRYIKAYAAKPSYYYAESLSEITTTSSTAWENVCTLDMPAPSSGDFLVIATMQAKSSTTLGQYGRFRLVRDETNVINYAFEETDNYYHSFISNEVLSASGSASYKYQLQIKSESGTTYITAAQNSAIIAIRLPSGSYVSIDNQATGSINNATFQNHSVVTVTPPGPSDDYWVVHSANFRSSSNTQYAGSRLYNLAGSQELTYSIRDHYNDINERFTEGGFSVLKGISSDVTLAGQIRSINVSYFCYENNNHIAAVRLSDAKWAGYADNALYTEQSQNSATGTPAATKTFTVTTPRNYLIMGSCSLGDASTIAGYYPVGWLQHDCASSTTVLGEMSFYEVDSNLERASFAAMRRMFLAAGSHTITVFFKRGLNSTTHYARCPAVIAIPLGSDSSEYSNASNVVEACTLAVVPSMDNTTATFTDESNSSVTATVERNGNPPNTAMELFYAGGDAAGPTEAYTSAGTQSSGYSWSVGGLDYDRSYWFKARAQNWVGIWTGNCSVTVWRTEPGIPTGFSNTDCTSTTLEWSWSSLGADGYDIFNADTDATVVSDIAAGALSTDETGLQPNTTYRRYIKSYWIRFPLVYYYAENLPEVSTTSSTVWSNVCTLNMTQPKAGDYLIIAAMQGKASTTFGAYGEFRLVRDETNEINYGYEETDNYFHSFMSSEVLTASGSDDYKYQLQIQSSTGTTYITAAQNAAIIAIQLSASNYHSIDNLTEGSTTSASFIKHSGVTVSPPGASDDYWLIHCSNFRESSTAARGYSRLYDGSNELMYGARDPYNVNEWFTQGGFSVLKGISSDVTLEAQYYRSSGTSYEKNVHIAALRLSDFTWNGYADNALYTQQQTTSSTGAVAVTRTFNVAEPQNYLIMGSCSIGLSTYNIGYYPIAWLEHNCGSGTTVLGDMRFYELDSNAERASFVSMRRMYLAAGSHTVRIMFRRSSAYTAYARCPAVIAIPLEGDIKEYSDASNVAEACTLAAIPSMDNTIATFIDESNSSITAMVDLYGNPPNTAMELFYAGGDAAGPTEAYTSAGTQTTGYSWSISSLDYDRSYWFKARAQNWVGIWTDCCSVTVWTTEPGIPTNFRNTDCTSDTLEWSWNSLGGDGYIIYDADTDGAVVSDIAAGAVSTVETGLQPNTTYRRYIMSYWTRDPLTCYYSETLGEISTTSSTVWSNVCTLSMTQPEAGDYLVIAAMQAKASTSLGAYGEFRLVRDETNELNYAMEETDNYFHSFISTEILTASGSDDYKYQLQIQSSTGTTYITAAQNAAIIAIQLSSSNDYNVDNLTQASTTSASFVRHTGLTVSPAGAGDDYWIIHSSNFRHDQASVGYLGYSRLYDGSNELTYSARDPYNAVEWYTNGGFSVLKGISSDVTLEDQHHSTLGWTSYDRNVHLAAIRLNDYTWDGYADNALYTEQSTTSATGVPAVTRTFTVTTPQNYLIMGSCGLGISTTTATYTPFAWLEHDCASGTTVLGEMGYYERDSTTDRASFVAMRRLYLAAGSHTVRVMFRRLTSGTAYARCPSVIAVPLGGKVKEFSVPSNVAEACTLAAIPYMDNTANTFTDRGSNFIDVQVDNSSNPGGTIIELFRAPDSGGVPGAWTSEGTNTTDYLWNVAGLAAESTYWFKARAQNHAGIWTGNCSVTTYTTYPGPPSSFWCADCTSTTLTWEWTDVTGEDGFEVHDNATEAVVARTGADTVTTVETGLSPNTSYVRHCHAFNGVGGSYTDIYPNSAEPGSNPDQSMVNNGEALSNLQSEDNASYWSFEKQDFPIIDPVEFWAEFSFDISSTGFTGADISNVSYTAKVFFTGHNTLNTPTDEPIEVQYIDEAVIQIYNFTTTSWEPMGGNFFTTFRPTLFRDCAESQIWDNFTDSNSNNPIVRFKDSGWSNDYVNSSGAINIRLYIKCSVDSGGWDGVVVFDHVKIDVDGLAATFTSASPSAKAFTLTGPATGFSFTGWTSTSLTMGSNAPPNAYADSTALLFDFVAGGGGAADSAWLTTNTYTDVGLSPNTSYEYRAVWRNGDGVPDTPSASDTDYTLTGPPTGFGFTGRTDSQISMSCDAPPNAYAGSTAVFFEWISGASGGDNSGWLASNTYTDNGLSPNTTYEYRVSWRNGDAREDTPTSSSFYGTMPVVPVMTNTTSTFVNRGSDFIDVQVDNATNPGDTVIELFRAPDSGGAPGAWTSEGTNTTDYLWNITGLAFETAYWFKARAQSWDGEWTANSSVTTYATYPGPPSNFRCIDCSSTTLTWAWDDVTGEDGYEVHDNGTEAVVAATGADVATTIETGLSPNATYVRHCHAYVFSGYTPANVFSESFESGTTGWTLDTYWTRQSTYPRTGLWALRYQGGYSPYLWNASYTVNTAGYQNCSVTFYFRDDPGNTPDTLDWLNASYSTNGGGSWTQFYSHNDDMDVYTLVNSGVIAGSYATLDIRLTGYCSGSTAEYWWIDDVAVDGLMNAKVYTSASNVVATCTAAAVPFMDNTAATFTAEANTSITVQVGPNGNPPLTPVELFYAEGDAGGPTVAFTSAGSKTSGYSWDVTGLTPYTSYWFQARAQNWAGIWSDNSAVTTWLTKPSLPLAFGCIGCTSDSLTWTWTSQGGEGFDIFDNGTDTITVPDIAYDATYTVETGLSTNTTYRRYLKAFYNVTAGIENCAATTSGYVSSAGSKWSNTYMYFYSNSYRGYYGFDLSSLSAGMAVTGVKLYAYCYNQAGATALLDIWDLTTDPAGAAGLTIYSEAGGGTLFIDDSTDHRTIGFKVFTFAPGNASSWVENSISLGWCGLGFDEDTISTDAIYFRAWNYVTVAERPVLEVSYEQKSYTEQSNVAEACTAADVPTMDNTAATFTAQNESSITVQVGSSSNPPDTPLELFYAKGDSGGPTEAFTSAGLLTSGYSWQFIGLDYITSYWFKARAQNWSANWSDNCAVTAWSTETIPAPTGFCVVDCTSSTITWGWTDGWTGEDGFEVLEDGGDVVATTGADATEAIEPGLAENTQYTRLARAFVSAGPVYSGNTNTASAYTLCDPPVAGEITFPAAAVTSGSMNVNLAECPNPGAGQTAAEFIEVGGQFGADNSPWVTDRIGGNFTYQDTGLTANTSYYWNARYRNGDGIPSAYLASAVPRCTLVADPLDTEISFNFVTSNSMEISVLPPANQDVGNTGAQFDETSGSSGASDRGMMYNSYSYVDDNLAENTLYSYRVRFQNQVNDPSNWSNPPRQKYTLVKSPTGFAFDCVTETFLDLSVTPPAINPSTGNTGAYFDWISGIGGAVSGWQAGTYTYTDGGLSPNVEYTYVVRLRNVEGAVTLEDSPADSRYTLANIPETPYFGTVSENSIEVFWGDNNNPGYTEYVVRRSENGAGWTQEYNGSNTTFTDTNGVTPNTNYTYSVCAINGDGIWTDWSANNSIFTPAMGGPAQFYALDCTTSSITWTWTNMLGESEYEIHDWDCTAIIIIDDIPADTTTAVESPLTPNYHARRKVLAIIGGSPSGMTANSAYTLLPPPTFDNLTLVSNDAYTIELTAAEPPNQSSGLTGVHFMFVSGGLNGDNSNWQTGGYTYIDYGLQPNRTYSYSLKYRNGDGVQTVYFPGSKSIVTLGAVPGAPQFSNITGSSVTLAWADNGNPGWTTFEISRSNGGPFASIDNVTGTTYNDSGLAGSTTYTYRIRSINLEDKPSAWSVENSFETYPANLPVVTILSDPVLVYGNTAAPGLEFECDQSRDYVVQLGGDGSLGSGVLLASGNCTAGVPILPLIVFNRADLDPDNVALTVYVTCYVDPTFLGCATCIVYDDHIAPTTVITYPADGQILAVVDSISGTVTEAGGGNVGLVELLMVRNQSPAYYDNVSNSFMLLSPTWFAVPGATASWSLNAIGITFTHNRSYTVWARSMDSVGNIGPVSDNVTFIIDETGPSVIIDSPPAGSMTVIGPVVDASMTWHADVDCDYFLRVGGNGSISSGVDAGSGIAIADESIVSIVPPTLFPDDVVEWLYIIVRAGNGKTANQSREFHDDETPPVTSVTTTLSGTMTPPTAISGTSSDDTAGLDTVEIAIRETISGLYFAPVSGLFEPGTTWLLASGTNSWTYDTRDVPWKDVMGYTVSIRVTDLVGNVETHDVGDFTGDVKPGGGGFFPKKKGGGGCFMATACYESKTPGSGFTVVINTTGMYCISAESYKKLETLRAFRDGVLSRYDWGRAFTGWYYRASPSLAGTIRSRPATRTLVRWFVVTPAYLFAREVMGYSYFLRLLAFTMLLTALVFIRWRRRKPMGE